MSTETTESVGVDAGESQTTQPEPNTADLAHQQNETDESADQSKDSEGKPDGLTLEQRTIRKLESRIARLTGKRGAAEREASLLREELDRVRQTPASRQAEDDGEKANRQFSPADIDRLANERAAELRKRESIGERVGKVIEAGRKLEGFSAAADAVAEIVPFTDRKGQPTPFIEAVLDCDDSAAVIKYLGDNPDEAEDLADLTPVQLGRRLAKLENQLKQSATKKTSAAPKPLQPIAGNGGGSIEPDPAKDTEAWIRARNRTANR